MRPLPRQLRRGDPIHDLEIVVAAYPPRSIFGESLREHDDPDTQIIAQAQASGPPAKEPVADESLKSISRIGASAPGPSSGAPRPRKRWRRAWSCEAPAFFHLHIGGFSA